MKFVLISSGICSKAPVLGHKQWSISIGFPWPFFDSSLNPAPGPTSGGVQSTLSGGLNTISTTPPPTKAPTNKCKDRNDCCKKVSKPDRFK